MTAIEQTQPRLFYLRSTHIGIESVVKDVQVAL